MRQPLSKILVPALDKTFATRIDRIKNLVLSEVNVKALELITEENNIIVKKVKPNFKALGPKAGARMKDLAAAITALDTHGIALLEQQGWLELQLDGQTFVLNIADVDIVTDDIPGWQVAANGKLTVALDTILTPELEYEGIARELVNRIQNMRKEQDFEVTDRINVIINQSEQLSPAIARFKAYICQEVLADSIEEATEIPGAAIIEVNDFPVSLKITRNN